MKSLRAIQDEARRVSGPFNDGQPYYHLNESQKKEKSGGVFCWLGFHIWNKKGTKCRQCGAYK